MEGTNHYGLILRHLREQTGLSVRKLSEKIGKSIGWISEIENNTGTARLTDPEFERIVAVLDGGKHREMFRTWVANYNNGTRVDRTFDGAVLKFIRRKKELSLDAAARLAQVSAAHLSKCERGIRPISGELRKQLMLAYGYSPSSFKNLNTDPARSKSVPLRFKLEILMQKMSEAEIESVYQYVREMKLANSTPNK